MKSFSMLELITYTMTVHAAWLRALSTMATQVQQDFPSTHLAISPLLPRSDNLELNDKIKEANKILNSFCSSRGLTLLHITNIDLTCLNRRGVHLNRKGSTFLTNSYADFLRSNWTSGSRPAIPTSPRSTENFNCEFGPDYTSRPDLTFN